MTLDEYLASLDYQPIETLPWIPPAEDESEPRMPRGIVLRYCKPENSYEIVGDNVHGEKTKGCWCCSYKWTDVVEGWKWSQGEYGEKPFDGWAWVWKDRPIGLPSGTYDDRI